MGYIESKSPHCGKVNRFSCNTYAYGDPAVLCLVQFIRIKCGFEDKSNVKHLEESRERLKDKSYAKKLASYGYNVPDEYLK